MNYISNSEYEKNIILENENKILNFFDNFNENLTIRIKVLNFDDFKLEYETYLENDYNDYVTGFIEDDTNTIVYLKYDDWKYTKHKDEEENEYNKVIIHEFVHIIHSNYCNKNYPNDELWEGIAYYLADQKGSSYYNIMDSIIKNTNIEQILKMLKNE